MQAPSNRTTPRAWTVRVRLGLATLLLFASAWFVQSDALACRGTPRPPMWGRSTNLAKAVPAVFVLAGPGGPGVVGTRVVIGSTGPIGAPPCTPVSTTITLILTCVPPPPGPPGAVVGTVTFATPTTGAYLVPVPVLIPPGPVRICTIRGVATTTWANGATSIGRGDIEICIVDPAPGEPIGGAPRLDLQLLTPEVRTAHPGDQREHMYRLTNNDPTESVTITLTADSEQVSRVPGAGGTPEPPGSGSGVYAIADPGNGDNFPIQFSEDLYPTPGPGNNYILDDGTQETDAGSTKGAVIWINEFTVAAGAQVIDKISVAYGTGANGQNVSVLLYADPDQDGDPSDAVLLTRADSVGANEDTGIFNEVKIEPTVVGTPGQSFFVGVVMQEQPGGTNPAAIDNTTDQGRSWFVDNGTCTADVEDLTNNAALPARITDLGVPGNWMLRAHGRPDLPLLGWVPLPPDPTAFPPPVISKQITLCPGESRTVGIATRSFPMCPPGSGCEQRVKLLGTFSNGDPALACAAAAMFADTTDPPEYLCPDGGMMAEVAIQPPFGLDYFATMPTHPVQMSVHLLNPLVVPHEQPPLLAKPPQPMILDPTLGRLHAPNFGLDGPAIFVDQLFDVMFEVEIASKIPDVLPELIDALMILPPDEKSRYFLLETRSRLFGPTIPPSLETFFDTFAHVTVDGITPVGPLELHHAAQILPGSINIQLLDPVRVGVQFTAVFPFNPDLPPQIDLVAINVDPGGHAHGLIPPPPCPEDIDGDLIIGFADLLIVLSTWGPCPPVCPGDIDGDGIVGFADLLLVLSNWGTCP